MSAIMGTGVMIMRYIVKLNNKEYEVEVENGKAGVMAVNETTAQVAAAVMPSQTAPAASAAQAAKPAPAAAAGGEAIKAPMPGTILDIKVSPGAVVKKGQVLLILEAMKMENEIVAPTAGTVIQIQAVKGSSVNAGDVLAVIG
jgi:biotin carboxyl carrier protein